MDYGLIGEKLGHSYSKEIHEMLAGYTYDIHPLSKDEFKGFMEKHEFKAINVTIPYKRDVIPFLYGMDEQSYKFHTFRIYGGVFNIGDIVGFVE